MVERNEELARFIGLRVRRAEGSDDLIVIRKGYLPMFTIFVPHKNWVHLRPIAWKLGISGDDIEQVYAQVCARMNTIYERSPDVEKFTVRIQRMVEEARLSGRDVSIVFTGPVMGLHGAEVTSDGDKVTVTVKSEI